MSLKYSQTVTLSMGVEVDGVMRKKGEVVRVESSFPAECIEKILRMEITNGGS